MAEFIKLYPENPELRKIQHIVQVLKDGGVIIYPTDTVYGLGCDIFNNKALDRIKLIKGIKGKNLNLSFICYDLSSLSEYAKHVDTPVFKMMKKAFHAHRVLLVLVLTTNWKISLVQCCFLLSCSVI